MSKCPECGKEVDGRNKFKFCLDCKKVRSREYYRRSEVKEKIKKYLEEYNQRPKVKEKRRERHKEYRKTPKYKNYMGEYWKRPEVKERYRERGRRANGRVTNEENAKAYDIWLQNGFTPLIRDDKGTPRPSNKGKD